MQKFQCLKWAEGTISLLLYNLHDRTFKVLYVLKGPYLCYYIIYMTVPLKTFVCLFFPEKI